MWTDENRGCYDRSSLRYPSDLTDAEWSLVEGLIAPGKRSGRWRTVSSRALRRLPGAGGTRGRSYRCHYRQPERQERGKGGRGLTGTISMPAKR